VTHRRVDERAEAECRRERVSPTPVFSRIDLVDPAEEFERVAWRQLIPQLRALAEHGADAKRQLPSLPRRVEAEHAHLAGIGLQNSREHLQCRRFASAVGSDERDAFTRRDRKRQAVDGCDRFAVVAEQIANATANALSSRAPYAKRLRQLMQVDGGSWHGDAPCRPVEACRK